MLFRKYNPDTLSKLSAHQLEQLLRKELAKKNSIPHPLNLLRSKRWHCAMKRMVLRTFISNKYNEIEPVLGGN